MSLGSVRNALLLVALAIPTAIASSAYACKCRPLTVEESMSDAVAIFEGRVTQITDEPVVKDGPPPGKRVTLSLVRTWKGLEHVESITLHTSESSASCGFMFEPNSSYLVYAGGELDALTVTTCSRTRPMSEAGEDLAELGVGITPVNVEPVADAGASDAGASDAGASGTPPKVKAGGCASSSRGAHSSLWLVTLPVVGLVLSRRRR